MPRTRKAAAILCIALVVFAAFVPSAFQFSDAVLIPLWIVIPAVVVTLVRRRASRSSEQPVALLSLVLLRAPPVPIASF